MNPLCFLRQQQHKINGLLLQASEDSGRTNLAIHLVRLAKWGQHTPDWHSIINLSPWSCEGLFLHCTSFNSWQEMDHFSNRSLHLRVTLCVRGNSRSCRRHRAGVEQDSSLGEEWSLSYMKIQHWHLIGWEQGYHSMDIDFSVSHG